MNKSDLKGYIFVIVFVLAALGAKWYLVAEENSLNLTEKVYIAVEGEGTIAVLNPATLQVAREIDLTVHGHGGPTAYMPHNVQVSPDGSSVWVTANAGSHDHSYRIIPKAYADESHSDQGTTVDQLVVIDPKTDKIVTRIDIGAGQHLAHIVLTADGKYAYASAQTTGKVYKVNAKTYKIEQVIEAGNTEPHGLRISPDGKTAYIALLKGNALGMLDLGSGRMDQVKLEGAPVQAAVSPDGKYSFATIYDKKSIAVYDTMTKKMDYIRLPGTAKGPVQLYPTPDSKYLYVADQGYYFGQPNSNLVYKIDVQAKNVTATIQAGTAPHGAVVSNDGSRAYVTNLLSKNVTVINTATDAVIGTVEVGAEPNGISIWSKTSGGTP